MSLFQSGPYESKVLSYVVRQTRRWVDQGSAVLRQVRVTASWTAQIVLYPIYAAVQTVRLAGVQLQQVVELRSPRLRAAQSQPVASEQGQVSAIEIPIVRALQTVEQFPLPVGLPVLTQAPQTSTALSRTVPQPQIVPEAAAETGPGQLIGSIARLATRLPRSLGFQSATSGKLAQATEKKANITQGDLYIRAIASALETRSLVLVTNENQSLDLLTPQQQAVLQQRITWEVAHYTRYQRLRQETRRLFSQVSPQTEASADPNPAQILGQVTTWVKFRAIPAVAQAVGAIAGVAAHTQRLLQGRDRGLSDPQPTLDLPLQQALQTVQRWTLPPALADGLPQGALVQVGQQSHALLIDATGALTAGAGLREYVRGIATWLETRSLVLVTQQNHVLDILTLEQQKQLHRRIALDVASLARVQQIRQARQRVFTRLQPPLATSYVLPPIRAFWQVMAWVQSGPVAIAANLFQEATLMLPLANVPLLPLDLGTAGLAETPAAPMLQRRSLPPQPALPALQPSLAAFFPTTANAVLSASQSAAPVSLNPPGTIGGALAVLPPALPTVIQTTARGALATISHLAARIPVPSSLSAVLAARPRARLARRQATAIVPPLSSVPSASTASADLASRLSAPETLEDGLTVPTAAPTPGAADHRPDYIEAQATLMGYLQSPIEQILRWLDRFLLWLESVLLALWKYIRQYF